MHLCAGKRNLQGTRIAFACVSLSLRNVGRRAFYLIIVNNIIKIQVAGIVIGSMVVAGIGGFAIFWFAVKKKTFTEFIYPSHYKPPNFRIPYIHHYSSNDLISFGLYGSFRL